MNRQTLQAINNLFDIPPLRYIGKAKGGFLSDNYILSDGTIKYFLKQYRPSVGDRLPVIAKTEQFFSRNDIPIILPIKTVKQKSYFNIDGNNYSLFPYISGKTFNHNKEKPTPRITKSIATNLALMHLLSKKNSPTFSRQQLSEWDPKKVLSKKARQDFYKYANRLVELLKTKKRKSNFNKTALAILKLKISVAKHFPEKPHSYKLGKAHLAHGDYHAQNVFLNKEGEVTHIFDLEKTDLRPRSLELVRSMFFICFNANFTPDRYKLARTYLEAYRSVYPIKNTEIEHAIRFLYQKHILNLWIEKGHYLNNYKRADILLPGELKFLRYMSKNIEILIHRLLKN